MANEVNGLTTIAASAETLHDLPGPPSPLIRLYSPAFYEAELSRWRASQYWRLSRT